MSEKTSARPLKYSNGLNSSVWRSSRERAEIYLDLKQNFGRAFFEGNSSIPLSCQPWGPQRKFYKTDFLPLLPHFNSHGSGRSLNNLHRRVNVVGIEINHLLFGDFPYFFLADFADFLLRRNSRTLFNAGGLFK